jgi:HTH-type transcriptional regulator, transcriptional repressor of NAD biosynthesis genes
MATLRMTLGFIVGKFYPPHRGHGHLIRSARAQVDDLIVMVAAHPSQSIPGEVRKQWLERIHPDCDVRLVPDELGPDDTAAWADFTVRYLGRAPDVVFSSEDYGPRYASLMGARHVMVDRERRTVPVSGTAVRASPASHAEHLEPCVRAWFVPRVVLVGAESTGKTTLAAQLAEDFGTSWVPEYGREHWEHKVAGLDVTAVAPAWSAEEFVHIATTQQAREWRAAESARGVLVCDTNAFATGTWFERYFGERSPEVDRIGAADRAALYLLTRPDVPFVQDGYRDGEHVRAWMDRRFEQLLVERRLPYVVVEGPYEERRVRAREAVARVLEGSPMDRAP